MPNLIDAKKEWIRTTVDCLRLNQKGREEPFRGLGQASAWIEFIEPDRVVLKKIEVTPNVQKKGEASRLLKHLIQICDRHDLVICGNVEPYAPDGWPEDQEVISQESLVHWYEQHGFNVHRDRAVVFMTRVPRSEAMSCGNGSD